MHDYEKPGYGWLAATDGNRIHETPSDHVLTENYFLEAFAHVIYFRVS